MSFTEQFKIPFPEQKKEEVVEEINNVENVEVPKVADVPVLSEVEGEDSGVPKDHVANLPIGLFKKLTPEEAEERNKNMADDRNENARLYQRS